jgi:hypothetical protein
VKDSGVSHSNGASVRTLCSPNGKREEDVVLSSSSVEGVVTEKVGHYVFCLV